MQKKFLVSFSVYGEDPIYRCGAIANAIAVKQFFPGWQARYYIEHKLEAQLRSDLQALDAEVICMKRIGKHDGMFWRFLAVADSDADTVIVRDVDALLCERNKYVVDEWIDSGMAVHIIRDHPFHRSLMLGGLWGARGGVLPEMATLIEQWNHAFVYGDDMNFLAKRIYPRIRENSFIHSDYIGYEGENVHPIAYPRAHNRWLGFPPARSEITQKRIAHFQGMGKTPFRRLSYSNEPE